MNKILSIDKQIGVLKSEYTDVEPTDLNIWQYLHPKLKKWGDLPAYVMAETEESLSYKELLDKGLRWAYELKKYFKGPMPPTVTFVMKNNIDLFPFFLGCYAVGVPLCPISEDLKNEMFEFKITRLKPDIVVIDSSSYEAYGDILGRLANKPCLYLRGHPQRGSGIKDFQEVLNSGIKLDESEAGKFESTAAANKGFSSGTTGAPKCIVSSHRSLTNAITSFSHKEINPLSAADVSNQAIVAGFLSLGHLFDLEYFAIFAPSLGCKVIYMENDVSIQNLVSAIEKYKPELIRLRYHSMDEFCKIDNADPLKSLKTLMFTGSPSNVASFHKLNAKLGGKLFFQYSYGSTETNIISSMPVTDLRPEKSGKLVPNCQARFVDPLTEQNITEPNEIGRIYIKTLFLMDGYDDNPEATKAAVDSEGWYYTGDIGYFDEDHFIQVLERINDIITVRVGEEKRLVLPTNLERVVKLHEGVDDAAVVGIVDKTTGEEVPKAFVICKYPVEEDELIKFVEQRAPEEMRLAGGVTFVKDLPRNPMGKLNRKFLREIVWQKI